MKKFLQKVKRGLGDFFQFFILSPRWTEKLYNPILFDDDKSGQPVANPPSFADVAIKQDFIPTVGGAKLNSWFFKHPSSPRVLLFNIGRSGDIQQKLRHVRLFLDAGISVFVFEYRGFGASPGKATVHGICQDGLAAYDYVVGRLGYAAEDIVIFGESLGAAVAANTSSVRKSRGLVMQAGFTSLVKISEHMSHLPWLPAPTPQLNNLAIVKEPHPPLLIVHGALDPVIPVAMAHQLYNAAAEVKTLQILPNSKHSDLGMALEDIPLFEATIKAYLTNLG